MDEVKRKRRGLAIQILAILAETNFPGKSRGELRTILGVPPDTEICSRLRELRDHDSYGGFAVITEQEGATWRYWMGPSERQRAKAFLEAWDIGKSKSFIADHPSPLAKHKMSASDALDSEFTAQPSPQPSRSTHAVHHINGDTNDNRPENIAIVELSERG